MKPNQKITIDLQIWEKTLSEIKKLKQQNQQLKQQVQQLQQKLYPNNGIRGRHSLTQSTLSFGNKNQENKKEEKLIFKTQMSEWLKKINQSKTLRIQKQNARIEPSPLIKIDEELIQAKSLENNELQHKNSLDLSSQSDKKWCHEDSLETKREKKPQEIQQLVSKTMTMSKRTSNQLFKQKKQIKLIESICLYGPNEQHIIEDIANRKMLVGTSLLYSSLENNQDGFRVYGEYFYPEGQAAVRNLRQDQVPTQINQIIFRKNTKKEDCSVFLFRGDQNNQQLQIQNAILSKVNPGKWLLAFFVQFTDFEALDIQDSIEIPDIKINRSVDEARIDKQRSNLNNECETDRAKVKKTISTHFVKSKYTLCIFTYFPLINVMEQVLSSILDEIKIKRFQKFADENKMRDVSIKFFIKQLTVIGKCIENQIQNIPPSLASNVEIKFGTFSIIFDMSESKLDELLFSGWAHDVLKIFEKDVLYDLFTNMMTQQSLCFVSENMHLLTYVIFFFVCIMPFPFTYPHPCISKVFNYELLESPFVVTAGINQSSKWVQENVANYPKKIFIDLNDESKIKGKKKPKNIKSEKLKKIFNTLYKKIEPNSPMPQIFKKKETIIRPASRQQNQSVISFIKSLQVFYIEQIFNHLPNPAIISFLRQKIEQKNETSKIFNILKQIQKYLKQSRRHKEKDQFVDLLVQQQIFYVHMGSKYALD